MRLALLPFVLIACGTPATTVPDGGCATWYTDADGDGYGDITTGQQTCAPDDTLVSNGRDCDDTDPDRVPEAVFDGTLVWNDGWSVDPVAECIGEVNGDIFVFGATPDIDALHTVARVDGRVDILGLDDRPTLGLSQLTHIGTPSDDRTGLSLQGSFSALPDLSSLEVIDGELRLESMELQSLDGLAAPTGLTEVFVRSDVLTSFDGLGPRNLSGSLILSGVPGDSLDSLPELSVEGRLEMQGIDLTQLSGSLSQLGDRGLTLRELPQLTTVSHALEQGSVEVTACPSLQTLELTGARQLQNLALTETFALDTLVVPELESIERLQVSGTSLTQLELDARLDIHVLIERSPHLASVALDLGPEPDGVLIQDNDALSSVVLTGGEAASSLFFSLNPVLQSVQADDVVQAGGIQLAELPVLSQVSAASLEQSDVVDIWSTGLADLSGFPVLTAVDELVIRDASALQAVNAPIGGSLALLEIEGAPALTSLQGLAVTHIGALKLTATGAVIDGPPALAAIDDVQLGAVAGESLPAFPALTEVGFFGAVDTALVDLEGWPALESVDSAVFLDNDALVDLSAWHGIPSFSLFHVVANDALQQAEVDAFLAAVGEENIDNFLFDTGP